MKSMSIVLWYFFAIYATSVIVNFSHYHKTLGDDWGESMILSAAKCLMHGQNDPNGGENTCKLSFQYKKETVLYFLKNLLSRKEFKQAYKLTVKSGSKKGASDLVNITLDLKPLFAGKNSPNAEKLNFWHSFYIIVSILLITLITPLYPLTNYIYLITLASMFILSLTIYLQLIKLIVFAFVYLITLGKYKFWLLPNLNKDTGILGTFWPLYEFKSNGSSGGSNGQLNESNNSNDIAADRPDETSNDDRSADNKSADEDSGKTGDSSKCIDSKQAPVETGANQSINQSVSQSINRSVTEFEGNDQLPTITTTPPPTVNSTTNSIDLANSRILFGRPAGLEIIDLNASDEHSNNRQHGGPMESEGERSHSTLENRSGNEMSIDSSSKERDLDEYANITPVISYLNVNEMKQRKRFSSNRSDDGFEILNDDFLHSPPIIVQQKQSTPLFLAKQSLL